MTQIKDALIESNPWWKREFSMDYKDREIFGEIQKFIPLPQIISITGLRRVGKTTIMLKIISDAIQNGMDPQNIMYFTFDGFRSIDLNSILKEYETLVERNLRSGSYLFLFDEIQKLTEWSDQLKRIYDLHQKSIKIIISGSESLFIRKESREILAGRIFEFKMEPLTFREFLTFKNTTFEPINLYEKELEKLFSEFILTQGFPELVNITDKDIITKYIKESVVEKVIYRDLPLLLNIKDISLLESILNIFMENPGQIVNMNEIASDLGVSRQTISLYLSYLEKSFLLKKLYNFSRNRRKVERKLKRYYPSFISPALLFRDDDYSKSKVFEWWMVIQLGAEFFWRDVYKHEVDIVLVKEEILPLEVKYGKVKYSGVMAFMSYFNIEKGYIITSTIEETKEISGKLIHLIPAFKFLLKK